MKELEKNKTLFHPFGNLEFLKILKEKNDFEIKEYGYWNNYDMPEKISENEWEQRLKDWNKVLPGLGFLNEFGLKYELKSDDIKGYFSFLTDEEIKNIEKEFFSEESLNIFLNKYLEENFLKIRDNLIEEFNNNGSYSNKDWIKARKFAINSQEFKKMKEDLLKKYRNKMKNFPITFNNEIIKITFKNI